MLDPKWFVAGFLLSMLVLLLTFDMRLGIAFGILIGAIFVVTLWIKLRLRFIPENDTTGRIQTARRLQALGENRRRAQASEDKNKLKAKKKRAE